MQCRSYRSGYYYSRDQTVDASGSLWQQFNNGVFCRRGEDYNILFQPPSIDDYLAYNKEILRQTMLKHEAVFKYQVHELHRLYGRQRELMDEIKIMGLSKDHLQMQTSLSNSFVSGMQCDASQKALQIPCWLLLNPRDDKPSAQGVENFQRPSSFISRMSIQADSDVYIAENHLKELEVSSRGRDKYGKKMLDLELPPEEYMDSDEGEQIEEKSSEVSPVLQNPSIRLVNSSPMSNLMLKKGASSNFNSISCSFDLNEPLHSDEPVTTNSTSLVDSNTSSTEIMHQDQDLSGKPRSKTSDLNEIVHNILEGKGSLETISGLQVPSAGKLPQSCNEKTSLGSKSTKKDQDFFATDGQRMLSPCITTSSKLVQLSEQSNTGASTSVSSQRESYTEVPIAIQELPCFNSPQSCSKTSRSSSRSSGIKMKYACSNRNPVFSPNLGCITSLMSCNSDNQPTAELYSVARCVKDSDRKNPVGDMDLNVMPSSSLPEKEDSQDQGRSIDGENRVENSLGPLCVPRVEPHSEGKIVECPQSLKPFTSISQFCTVTSINSNSNSSENEGIQNGEKVDIPAICMDYDSSHKSEESPKDDTCLAHESGKEISPSKTCIDLGFSVREKMHSHVRTVTSAVGTDLQAPVSPDNTEHCPPREESEDNRSEKLEDSIVGLERIAAEAIVWFMLSGKQQSLNTSINGPSEAFFGCLNWFAGIVCSVTGEENEFEDLLTDASGGNCADLASKVLGHSDAMTFTSTGTKVEDQCCMINGQKNKLIGDIVLPSQQGRGQVRKAREWEWNEFQSEVLPCASFSSYDVTANIQPRKELTVGARTAPVTVKGRKKVGRVSCARGRRQSKNFSLNVVSRRVCSHSKQSTCQSVQSFLQSCSFGWGKKHSRQKHRRARNSVDFGFS